MTSRKCESAGLFPFLLHSRSLALAFSSLAFFLKPVHFRHVWGFHVKTSCFYILIKRQISRSRVAHRLGSEHHRLGWYSVGSLLWRRKFSMHYLVFNDIHATLAWNCKYIPFNPHVSCFNVLLTNSMLNITFC